jgi:hypothetical protein
LLVEHKKATDPAQRDLNKEINRAIETIEQQIKKGSVFSGYSSVSVDKAYKAVKELQRRIQDVPEGVTVMDMLDPESQHYIVGDIIRVNKPTFTEDMDGVIENLSSVPDSELRKPGETPEDYLKRTK